MKIYRKSHANAQPQKFRQSKPPTRQQNK